MENFNFYISENQIILKLCKIRVQYAASRKRKLFLHKFTIDEKYNHHVNAKMNAGLLEQEEVKIMELLPPRGKWKKLNKYNRKNCNNQNLRSLLITINHYRKHIPEEPFLIKLDAFIKDVQDSINNVAYKFEKPQVIPFFKEVKDGENIYRPIVKYSLKDRIIIGLLHDYLRDAFDSLFYPSSFAFRAPRLENGRKVPLSHHDAVKKILGYKSKHIGDSLWVAECDIKKFFDITDQTLVMPWFNNLWEKFKANYSDLADEKVPYLFDSYLHSFSYKLDVLSKNGDKNYWAEKGIVSGKFEWAEGVTSKEFFDEMVGVPQGGALSGLIANIVFHFVDKKMQGISIDLLYLRYCDDMIIMHPQKEICQKAFNEYYATLKELNLIPYEPVELVNDSRGSSKKFWEVKSKSPYQWAADKPGAFQWIGFVGYEIHYSGAIRIRKKSLLKEKNKQEKLVRSVIYATRNGQRLVKEIIVRDTTKKMVASSVGRMNMSNYNTSGNQLSWINGFRLLNDNKYSRKQLKELDRNRTASIKMLRRKLSGKNDTGYSRTKSINKKRYSNEPKFYGRSFSFYYQVIKRGKVSHDKV